jgi:signal peptidase I
MSLVLLVLALVGVLVAGTVATGRAAFVATHGVSMNPIYYQGDLVVVAKADSYHLGQIVAYRVPAKGLVVLHRIIGENASGFVMKGDNNQSIDPTYPTAAQIVGRSVLHIPQGGLWLSRLTSPAALALIACAVLAGGGAGIQTRRRRRRTARSRQASHRTGSTGSVASLPPALRTAAAATSALGVLGLALGALAWTAPPNTLARTATQATRQMSFSYTSTVPRTPAYDSTTVRSPDPVFRRLSNTVELHLAYRGKPGSISVTADLSTPSGWHSTIPLTGPTSITTAQYQSTVRLDLNAFDARAQAAAAVTGLPAGPLTITIAPRITTAGAPPFQPTLTLNLTPLQLRLADAPPSLTVKDSTPVAGTMRVQRTLALWGQHIAVPQARTLSVALLLAVLLVAAVLTFIAQRSTPANEAAGIRRRYAPLLASVQPITTRPDLPLIEVSAFATLAKLAERCGLLVLHWTRSGIETFIVLDEGTTYRYRTGSSDGAKTQDSAPTSGDPTCETAASYPGPPRPRIDR